ncbi:MAG: PASTA domain-containing protein [Desulfobacter sp.]|nr:MAG: PASTA domain-containing protein [Desulfobacter sp.]
MKTLIKYLLLFLTAFALAGAAGYTGVSIFTRSAPEVILPELVGKNIIQVLETLTRLGLNPKLHTTQYHETIPKYGVTFQDPKAGATIKKGRDVVIYLSKGFKESRMPDLREMGLKEARLVLEAAELRPGRLRYVYSDRTPAQGIISQYPLADASVAAASQCDLLVSRGPRPRFTAMPDLEKLTLDAAVSSIDALSMTLSPIRPVWVPSQAPDLVLEQTPAPGTRVPAGTAVTLSVNHSGGRDRLNPEAMKTPVWLAYTLPPGFSNRHVRITTDLFGAPADAFNGFMKPGKKINILIPGGITTKIRIFIDRNLVLARDIDPWQPQYNPITDQPYTGEQL